VSSGGGGGGGVGDSEGGGGGAVGGGEVSLLKTSSLGSPEREGRKEGTKSSLEKLPLRQRKRVSWGGADGKEGVTF